MSQVIQQTSPSIQTLTAEPSFIEIDPATNLAAGNIQQVFTFSLTEQRMHQKTSGISFTLNNIANNCNFIDITFPDLFSSCTILMDGKTVLDIIDFPQYLKQQMIQSPDYNQYRSFSKNQVDGRAKTLFQKAQHDARIYAAGPPVVGQNNYFIPFYLFGLQQNSDYISIQKTLTINLTKKVTGTLQMFYSDLVTEIAAVNTANVSNMQFKSRYYSNIEPLQYYDEIKQKEFQNAQTVSSLLDQISIPVKTISYKRCIQSIQLDGAAGVYDNLKLKGITLNNQKLFENATSDYFLELCKNNNLQNSVQWDQYILFLNSKYTDHLMQQTIYMQQPVADAYKLLITYYSITTP